MDCFKLVDKLLQRYRTIPNISISLGNSLALLPPMYGPTTDIGYS